MCFISHGLLRSLLLSCLLVSTGHALPRETLNLDGLWSFATDPDNRGEVEKWYQPDTKMPQMPLPGYAPTATGTICVPGIWDNQGYGTETDKVRHNFVGKGWYKRQVMIPQSWAGRRTFLVITGVSRYAKVWIDDHFLGEHIGYLSVQEYDVTQYAGPSKTVTITIQVDSQQRWEVDAMFGASSLADYMDVAWGGIWGHISLEARPDVWLSDLFVQPNVVNSSCSASVTLNGMIAMASEAKLEVFEKNGQRVAEAIVKLDSKVVTGQTVTIVVPLPDVELWTPESPTLYKARLGLLKENEVIDVTEARFGMRHFTIDGYRLLLNGKRIMLLGYGDDHIYPEQMAMPSDKELHLKRLRIIKSYGFNHVRHHSTFMPPEYYEACDEIGIITAAEFPICYRAFLPETGETWKSRVPPGTDPSPAIETYKREWTAAIKRHRNHPSILCWVMGNEIYDGIPLRVDFQRIARELDPARYFVDSDGVWGVASYNGQTIFDSKYNRDTLDLYFTQFDEISGDQVNNSAKYNSPQPAKPMILHEAGNYVTFSRPDLADQFQHNIKPFWLTGGLAKLENLRLLSEADQWAEKSERLYALCHKFNLESARKNPYVSGYHWWLFQDYWTTANGIVDHYFRPKSITKEEVLKYNNEVVLLQNGLQRTYRGKEHLNLKLLVSNYSSEPLQGELVWEVKVGDQTISRQQKPLNPAPQGEVTELAHVDVELPEVMSPTKLTITTKIDTDEKHFDNNWSSWLYPRVITPASFQSPVFADETQLKQCKAWDVKPIPAKGDLSSHAVYAVSWLCDPRLVDAMNRGASVIILDGADRLMKTHTVTFRTSWWKAGDAPQTNHTGTFVYDHPATRAMAPDGWCDDGWFYLIEGGTKCVLESAPVRPGVILRALPSMSLIEDEALLFEVCVGKGSLIVSGLNHQQAQGRPENEWLIARLLDYAATFPQPASTWPISFLSVVSIAPEGCIPGFRKILVNEGEDGTWYSYREDNARVILCRQTQPGNRVTWETAPVPSEPASDPVTFVFAGSLGFSSEPKTEGFVLEINAKEMIRFDMPAPDRWESDDKQVELQFNPSRTISVDQFGLFHLTVPRKLLETGMPCRLSVRSLGTGSRRWFGLNPYF
jgi:beta-galactosidase